MEVRSDSQMPELVRMRSHKLLSVSASSSSDSISTIYRETPKALEELQGTESALDAARVSRGKKGIVSKIAAKILHRKQGDPIPKLEERREVLLHLLTNSLSTSRVATEVLFNKDHQEVHLRLVDFTGSQHDMTILDRLGEGADIIAVKVDDLVGGSEREGVLLVEKTPIAQNQDFIEDPLQFKSKTFEELRETKRTLGRLREQGISWTPKIYSIMVLSHPTLGYTKAELQEPLLPLSSFKGDKVSLSEKLEKVVEKTHRKGVTHGDLKPDNVLLRGEEPVLIDWDSKLMFERSDLTGVDRGGFIKIMEERRFATTDFVPQDYPEKVDALILRAMRSSTYDLESVKTDFIKLQKEKDNFGLACTLYEVLYEEPVPRSGEGAIDKEKVAANIAKFRGPFRVKSTMQLLIK